MFWDPIRLARGVAHTVLTYSQEKHPQIRRQVLHFPKRSIRAPFFRETPTMQLSEAAS